MAQKAGKGRMRFALPKYRVGWKVRLKEHLSPNKTGVIVSVNHLKGYYYEVNDQFYREDEIVGVIKDEDG